MIVDSYLSIRSLSCGYVAVEGVCVRGVFVSLVACRMVGLGIFCLLVGLCCFVDFM